MMNDYTFKIVTPTLKERWTIIKQCLFNKEIHIGFRNNITLHPDFVKEIMECNKPIENKPLVKVKRGKKK